MKTLELTDLEAKALYLIAAEGITHLSEGFRKDRELHAAAWDVADRCWRLHNGMAPKAAA